MKTLIFTNSKDVTTDLIITVLGYEKVFRLNFDTWHSYEFDFFDDGFIIKNKYHSISSNEVAKAYWRKPFMFPIEYTEDLKVYLNQEMKYIFREIYSYCLMKKKAIILNPLTHNKTGKIHQKFIANKYFKTPKFYLSWNSMQNSLKDLPIVVKTLSSTPVGQKFMYTTKAIYNELDTTFPWFFEEQIFASSDITVVYLDGEIFAYKLIRNNENIDWRNRIGIDNQEWTVIELTKNEIRNITALMKELDLLYGRLDFLCENDELVFLEVNPNGQWAWLDYDNSNGLVNRMCTIINPETPLELICS